MSSPNRIELGGQTLQLGEQFAPFAALPYHCLRLDPHNRMAAETKCDAADVVREAGEDTLATLEAVGVVRTKNAIYAKTAAELWDKMERLRAENRAKRARKEAA